MKKRNHNIDIIKGIAIYCVLWGHCIQCMSGDVDFFNLEAIKLIYSFHMPLFALISGYLFFRTSQKRAIDILKSRLISLGVPFCVWSLLLYIRKCIFDILTEHNFEISIMEALHALVSGLWFLKSLFIITVLATLIVKCSKKYKYLCSFAVWISLILFNNVFGDHTADLFPFFVLGYYVAEHKSIVEKIYKCRYIAYIAFIVLLIGMREEYFVYVGGINPVVSEYGFAKQVYFDLYRLIIGILGSSTFIMLVMQIGKYLPSAVNKFFEAMGRVTLQLYVLQSFFLEGVLSQLINHLPLSGGAKLHILDGMGSSSDNCNCLCCDFEDRCKNYWKGSSFVNCFVWGKKLIH